MGIKKIIEDVWKESPKAYSIAEKNKTIGLIESFTKKAMDKLHTEMEQTRLIRDRMIHRLRMAAGIESQELKVIESELIKIIKGEK